MCYECLACESKMASISNLKVGISVGCPLNFQVSSHFKVVGCPLRFPLSCQLFPYIEEVCRLIFYGKIP